MFRLWQRGAMQSLFVMEHENMTYPEALKYVAKKYGIEVQERELSPEEEHRNDDRESMMVVSSYAAEYFAKALHETPEGQKHWYHLFPGTRIFRCNHAQIRFGLLSCWRRHLYPTGSERGVQRGVPDRHRIDHQTGGWQLLRSFQHPGHLSNPQHQRPGNRFRGRTMRTDKKVAKYLNSPESEIYHKSDVLYGIYQAKRAITQQDCCILVEGYTDVISMPPVGS